MNKFFRVSKNSKTPKGSPTKLFGNLSQKFFNGNSCNPTLLPTLQKFVRQPNFSETPKCSPKENFGTVSQNFSTVNRNTSPLPTYV